jgi:uncharacterized membrane protein YeaQ/YmgE (transglycosylase-associated protein family)
LLISWLLSSSFWYFKKITHGGFEMDIIGAIIVGLIAGALAKAIMPGKDPGGLIVTILLGIVGGIIGTFIARGVFGAGDDQGLIMRIVFAIIGALILLFGYRLITGRNRTTV